MLLIMVLRDLPKGCLNYLGLFRRPKGLKVARVPMGYLGYLSYLGLSYLS
jgi:hypothetical protein